MNPTMHLLIISTKAGHFRYSKVNYKPHEVDTKNIKN
jgi:hypothetical protein